MTVDVSSMDGAQLPGDDFVPFSTSPTSERSPKKRKLNDSETDWPPPHVDALRSVLGDSADSETLGRLWTASGGSVERALNAFFDGSFDKQKTGKHAQHAAMGKPAGASAQDVSDIRPARRNTLPPGHVPSKQEPLRTSMSAAPPRQQVQPATASVEPRAPAAEIARESNSPETYYVGAFMVAGYATTKGRNLLSVGDQVRFERDRLAAPKVTAKKRGRTAGLSYPASVASRQRNVIVRFTNSRRLEVGRLPAEVARFVSTLLDQDIFVFTGSVIFAPENLKTGEDIILQVRAHVKRRALSRFSEGVHQVGENDREAKDQKLKDLRVAILSLIQRCGLKPTLSGAAAAKISGSDPDNDAVLKAAIAEAAARPKSAAPSNTSVGGDVGDGEVAYDEEKKVTEADLSILYTRAQRLDASLPEMKPSEEFGLSLRGYQRQALAWMYAKETEPCGQSEAGGSLARSREAMIHPLWEEYAFCSDEADSFPADTPSTWYFSPYSGEISITFPLAESQSRSGILADEMGLGKTIEILALVHSNQNTAPLIPKKQCKATLVVCPMSLLAQWRDESANACPSLKCQMYYGSARDSTTRFDSADIVLTSYGTLASEYASWTGSLDGQRGGAAPPLFAVEFYRVVLDEAHQIKNRLSKTAKACSAVEARRRWCVTGTPIQNKLEDLFSLVHFLRIKPWSNFLFWKAHITIPFEENKDYRALQTVQTVLEPIILMRTKNMKDARGRCIVDLPEKEILIERLDLTEQERDIYDSLFRDSKTKFNTYCAAGKVLSHFASIFQLLMRLRQVCDHPVLALGGTKDFTKDSPDGPVDINELIARFTKGDSYDSERGQVSQGVATAAFAQSVIQRLMRGAEEDKNGMSNECAICFEQTVSPVLMTTCMHTACRDCVMAYLQKRDDEGKDGECPICRKPLTAKDLVDVVQRIKGKPSDSDEGNSSTSASLMIDLRRNNFRSSTKLDALITHLVRIREQGSPGEGKLTRSVVFSQFTSMLDLVEVVLAKNDIPYGRLDGTMNQGQREKVLESFRSTTKGGPEVLLVSLRAGGVGLNLTSASEVFMMDPWWNFEIEKQAIDRVHRIGQTRKVTVRRFIVRDTVEEKMLTIQDRKSALAGGALGLNHEEAKERRLEELMILFK